MRRRNAGPPRRPGWGGYDLVAWWLITAACIAFLAALVVTAFAA